MDLTKPISYNGLTAANSLTLRPNMPSVGYIFDEIDVSTEAVAGFTDKRANQDGIDASDVFLGARTVRAIITPYGSTIGDFWDKAQVVLTTFSPTLAYNADTANLGFLPFDFYQPTANIASWPLSAYPNGIPLRFYLRPAAPPTYSSRRDEQGGKATNGLSKQMRLVLIARDPRKYLQAQRTATLAVSSATASATDTYLGDYPTTVATLVITSSSATGTVTYTIEGASFAITLDATSTTYTLDLAARTFAKGASLHDDLVTFPDSWPSLGLDGTVNLARTAATAPSSATLTYRPAFA